MEVLVVTACVVVATIDTQGACFCRRFVDAWTDERAGVAQPPPLSCGLESRSGYLLKSYASGTWCVDFSSLFSPRLTVLAGSLLFASNVCPPALHYLFLESHGSGSHYGPHNGGKTRSAVEMGREGWTAGVGRKSHVRTRLCRRLQI